MREYRDSDSIVRNLQLKQRGAEAGQGDVPRIRTRRGRMLRAGSSQACEADLLGGGTEDEFENRGGGSKGSGNGDR